MKNPQMMMKKISPPINQKAVSFVMPTKILPEVTHKNVNE